MTTQTCPDQATLENFLLGKLTATEQSAVSEHLQNCQRCTASANTLCPQDEITQAIRARKVLTRDEVAVALAAEKGKLLSSQLQTMQPDETVIGDKPHTPSPDPNATVTFGTVKTSDEALNFLAPAQGPDELGRLGDYRILELLGMGGMGMVFRAEDARLKRQVALKVMKPSVAASRTAKDRFLREAQFTAAIEHDNIVQIFQVGEDNGVPFIAMPFLKGESLKTRQERVGRMSQDGTPQPFEFPNDPANAVRANDAMYSKLLWRPDGNVLVGGPQRVVSPDQPAKWRLWSRDETGTAREFYSDPSTVDPPYPHCWSPDGKYLIIGQGKGVLKVLDVEGQLVKRIETGAPVYPCWNPVTNLIAVVENEQPLKFIDPARDWEICTVSEKIFTASFNLPPQWRGDGKVLTGVNGWFDDKGQPIPNSYPWAAVTWSPDGARFIPAIPDSSFRIVDTATGVDLRVLAVNYYGTLSTAWHPRGNMIAYLSGQSMVSTVRESDLLPHWHAVLLPEGKSATFSGAGELLNPNPEEIDPYLVYYIDRGDGRIETLTPAEFRKLLPEK